MSDLLTAASLFLAVVGLLYSSWYSEITKALAVSFPRHIQDRRIAIKETRVAYRYRALPLALASGMLAIILIPELVAVVVSAIDTIASKGLDAIQLYDAVKALFCGVAILSILLALHMLHLARQIRSHWKSNAGNCRAET